MVFAKIEAHGDTFRAYLDDVLQLEQTDARFTHGRICLYTDNAAARFRRIKVSDAKGKVLFEGLPDSGASFRPYGKCCRSACPREGGHVPSRDQSEKGRRVPGSQRQEEGREDPA